MNIDAIKKKLEEYYSTVTPEQLIGEFEELGVELVDIPELEEISYSKEYSSFRFQDNDWYNDFLVTTSGDNQHISIPDCYPSDVSSNELSHIDQFAIAA